MNQKAGAFRRLRDTEGRDAPRKSSNPPSSFLKSHIWFLLSALGWPGLALILVFYLEGQRFRIGYREHLEPFLPLYQTEISFIISGTDAVIKFCYTSWLAIMAWRLVYILLSSRGMSLGEIGRVAEILPPSFRIHRFKNHWKLSLAVLSAICLALPARYLSTPLLSGALAWVPVQEAGNNHTDVQLPRA